ncbi:MAG TPA: pyridoxamine 5'-phosphate oxidase family protein [Miltoncostaeaceae bacterium]|nr:pyridoxamine 5'-phosphate oxidase family protein [Miltoncostaeaceae bacterium]
MSGAMPQGQLDARYSSEGATATPWEEARDRVAGAGVHWLSTVRPNGRPHVTPLLAVWLDDAAHFCTGPDEQKARNLARSPLCALIAGSDAPDGLDVVIEGEAVRVTDRSRLRRLADAWVARHGEQWRFEVRDGAFAHAAGTALVFEVAAARVFAFGKGDAYSQTGWRLGGG